MMLDGKVVVVLGVGPGVGRSLALASAREGADVVLAARTASRLEEIAKEVAELGRRALPVPVDITDPEAGERLADAAMAEFGRTDALVYNALHMPPIRDLMKVDLDAVRDAFDANVITALRLVRQFVRIENVVFINSMVVRFSQRSMGPYKMVKSGLLAMASSLATELGPKGIRVNSIAPGNIQGDSLDFYFSYLGHKRGVDPQVIADETAARSDLGRLVLPDEVADAAVFLASPLARAITGQCLDVNCGEYHH
ncbi:MAG TPA: SDR family oxidoreductase [Streptosporangiaceae bacterium]|nr:SDR family oxidoreductase [Streptosporangiaceae bacterium]